MHAVPCFWLEVYGLGHCVWGHPPLLRQKLQPPPLTPLTQMYLSFNCGCSVCPQPGPAITLNLQAHLRETPNPRVSCGSFSLKRESTGKLGHLWCRMSSIDGISTSYIPIITQLRGTWDLYLGYKDRCKYLNPKSM